MRVGSRVKFQHKSLGGFGWGLDKIAGTVTQVDGNVLRVRGDDGYYYDIHKTKAFKLSRAKRKNPMTKKQRSARAKRAGSVRRKATAAAKMLKVMNPASKPKAVRIKRLKGGGVSIVPIKVKVGR